MIVVIRIAAFILAALALPAFVVPYRWYRKECCCRERMEGVSHAFSVAAREALACLDDPGNAVCAKRDVDRDGRVTTNDVRRYLRRQAEYEALFRQAPAEPDSAFSVEVKENELAMQEQRGGVP